MDNMNNVNFKNIYAVTRFGGMNLRLAKEISLLFSKPMLLKYIFNKFMF